MKTTPIIIILFMLISCGNRAEAVQVASVESDTTIQYTENELIAFLDSIGKLNPEAWVKELSMLVDSTLYNQTTLNYELTNADFEKLKNAIKEGVIDFDFAKRIFPELEVDSLFLFGDFKDKFPIELYSFDENEDDFKEFAILIGINGISLNSDVYFFNSKKIIAKHDIFYRYELELKHFKDESGKTVIYYNVCYGSGTGVWWYQFNFYQYNNEQLTPVLTEIQNINLQPFCLPRLYWIESKVVNEKPLQLKFVYSNQYSNQFSDVLEGGVGDCPFIDFINDSTIVTYHIDTESGKFIPVFNDSKLNRNKLLSYFLADNWIDNELLFINEHYDLFLNKLGKNDIIMYNAIMNYLNELKNAVEKR